MREADAAAQKEGGGREADLRKERRRKIDPFRLSALLSLFLPPFSGAAAGSGRWGRKLCVQTRRGEKYIF